jgi:hypothetical protein
MIKKFLATLAFATSCLFAAPPNDAVVVFNELHYNPPAGDAAEYVELINVMGVSVDISGWRLAGGVDFTFPNGTVIAGGTTLVVAKTPAMYAGALGPFVGTLSNSGETLRLRNNDDRAMDEVTYGDSGDWPVAPDGGGSTLAKRDAFTNSATPESWASSAQSGGTPGAANFPPPPAPVTTRAVNRHDTWSYNASGSVSSEWKTVAFNDSAWSTGQAGIHFGNPSIYNEPQAAVAGGQWFVKPWTGDADSEISSSKSYTHKIGINRATAYTAINGVTFDSPGSGVLSGGTWSITGAPNGFTNNGNGTGANNLPASTGSRQLCEEFYYGATNAGATSRITLAALTPGQTYTATFYSVGFGPSNSRQTRITPRDTGIGYLVDQNVAGSGNGVIVRYRYNAPGDGVMTFDFADTQGATWHHYAFSNEVSPTMIPQSDAPATVAGFSSELSPFSRVAANVVNGSGLVNGQHGTTPAGTMWLSNGTFTTPNDPLPAEITFDLGATVDLAGFQVWNYNEAASNLMTRGANQVVVQTASTAGGPFTTAATLNFRRALGVVSEPGERFDLNVTSVRQVKFVINSSHGGDNNFAGLSEVKFFKQGLAPAIPTLLKESIRAGFNTGVDASHALASAGTGDIHWLNVGTGQPAIVMNGNGAWFGFDGSSQWIGPTTNGTDNIPVGQSTYRTTLDFTGYNAADADVRFYVGADNSLDDVLLNGVTRGITASGFNPLLGPYTISGPFNAGANTVDFKWSNAGTSPNPGGFRLRWDIVTPPALAKTALASNPVTTYLRRTFIHAGSPTSSYRLLLDFIADDGAIFYLNGTEIHRVNMPAGAATGATLASTENLYPKFNGAIEIPATAFLPGQTNVLAVELHQASAGNADAFLLATLDVEETLAPVIIPSIRFNEIAGATAGTFFVEVQNTGSTPLALGGYQIRSSTGQIYTFGTMNLAAGALLSIDQTTLGFRPADGAKLFLATTSNSIGDAVVVKNAGQARSNAGAWLVPDAATPGTANTFTLNTSVVINEIMFNHHPAHLPSGTTPSTEEWVELYNRTGSPVLLTGWKLRGGMDFDFAPGTQIPANGYLVVAKDAAALLAEFPGISVVGPASGSLSNSDDTVRLEDAVGNPVSEVHYFDGGRWDERADGGGSSLELRNPGMDTRQPEAWAASDESAKASWVNISYSGSGAPFPGTNDPTLYHEFILGMINGGECLVDDISVREVSVGNRELIQNGTFTGGTTAWRNIGNHGSHGRTVVVPDPAAPGNNVLKIVATGPTEHMHNHCETTFASGITTNSASTYSISFRARWVSGTPRLQSRLYFNRLAKQHILPIPSNIGTPGAQNSRYTALTGPTFSGLSQSAALPLAQQPVTIRVAASDPQGVTSVSLKWRLDEAPAFSTVPMTLNGGNYEGEIPGQAAGALVQFYVEGSDGTTSSTFPAAGPNSRAFIRWRDLTAPTTPGHGIRILMAKADADFMHSATNVMSNDFFPCTVVYRESEVFYGARVRLKSSQRGRFADVRVGFAIDFDPMQKFRGAHTGINIDRSGYGRGTTGNGYGHSEIVSWHMFSRAGGVPSMYNDMIYVIAPRAQHTGSGILTMAEFNDVWADSQFDNGAAYPGFKYELIYFPTTTNNGSPEGLKLPQPDGVQGVEFGTITSPDKEAFRWNFLIGNARSDDDFTRLINLSDTYRLTGTAFNNAIVNAIDVDQWLRTSAALALAGIGDNYATSSGAWHNLKLYHRSDGRILYLPWDLDFQSQGATDALIINPDIAALTAISPAYQRLFYQHLQDIIATSFNSTYLQLWVGHYSTFNASGGNWNDIITYVNDRVAYVQGQINSLYPATAFDITTAGFSTSANSTTITGSGWLNVRTITIQAGGLELPVTWTSGTTWQVTIPVVPGSQTVTLQAYDYQGNLVGTDSITGFGTGTAVPAAAGNIVISELHYNPATPTGGELTASADPDEFEFIEIRNISTSTVSLAGCRFDGGLDYVFPTNTTLAPGAYAVVPRNTAAFAARYSGIATLPHYYVAGANFLSNSGEEIALLTAAGTDVARISYNDSGSVKWPASPDGSGPSLVLIAPMTNPDATDPLHWRASSTTHGNPGTSDALPTPIAPTTAQLLTYAIGTGAMPTAGSELILGQRTMTFTLERNPLADADWSLETTATLPGTWTAATTGYEITARTTLPGGNERITLRATSPMTAPSTFLRAKLRVP